MPEYIDRVDLIEKINTVLSQKKFAENTSSYFAFELFAVLLKEVPTADVAEVVRCKNCEHFKAYSHPLKGFYGQCLVRECNIGETDFCSYGKRKEGAEE